MHRKLKIFLLAAAAHPEEMAALGAEKEIIEEDDRFEVVNPCDFNQAWAGVPPAVGLQIDFRIDAHHLLGCDGVLLMQPVSQLGTHGNLLYAFALAAGLLVGNNTGDLMHSLLSQRKTLPSVTHPTPSDRDKFKAIGYVHENTVPCLEMGVVCNAIIAPVEEGSRDRVSALGAKYPVTIYARI